ncbi:unnamed protein product [Orchesella dallaii]|uniref:Uncharacterized protein n=1 Tax=Orchesella dallaii TaxID=48710 RepID=A0ABP1QJ03_9HEXA
MQFKKRAILILLKGVKGRLKLLHLDTFVDVVKCQMYGQWFEGVGPQFQCHHIFGTEVKGNIGDLRTLLLR